MKVVVNRCFGGFGLSKKATQWLTERGVTCGYSDESIKVFRTHPLVIEVVETMGDEASGVYADLKIIEIPFDGVEGWWIEEYVGMERVVPDGPVSKGDCNGTDERRGK